MARKKQPAQVVKIETREGQYTAPGGNLANFFMRNIPVWNPPAWQEAEVWRRFVEKQPLAAICRDRIADHLNSLDWSIIARDSEKRDELKPRIKHYTKLFERGNAYYYDLDFSSHIEFIVKDLFTLPFGTACEIGRLDNDPNGKVVWVRPLDAGTLAPTLNFDYPVMQVAPSTGLKPVYLPRKFVSRVFLSPRTELAREGWGYAPPERIWRAIEMMVAGDNYYAQLLLNTPEAGVLDLGDMDKTSALEWVKSLRDLLYGINPLKIPVLYEHEKPAAWIPFGKPPSEIMYDKTTMIYAAVLCAGYGLTLSDIGFPTSSGGGDTLAGTIRMERVSNSSGKSTSKKKTKAYFDRILPDSLEFTWIDYDDERNVSKGRARLASAQATQIWVTQRVFKPSEMRQQALADGLISVDVPENVEPNDPEFEALQESQNPFGTVGSKTKTLGSPVPPSSGGQGEKIPQQTIQRNIAKAEVDISKAVVKVNDVLLVLMSKVKSNLSDEELPLWEEYVDEYLIGKSDMEEDELKGVLDGVCERAKTALEGSWINEFSRDIVEKIIADENDEIQVKALYREESGEEPEIYVNKSSFYKEELSQYVRESLLYTVSNYCVLVAKSVIMEGFLDVDATEAVSNNIRVSKDVAKKVLGNLSSIINSVYEDGRKYLESKLESKTGDQDAVS